MLEGWGGTRWFTIVYWKAGVDPEGLPWYAGRQEWIHRFFMICWKAGVGPEGFYRMLEGRGGSRKFTMVYRKAGADPEGLPWYAGRQGWVQKVLP